MLKLWCILFCAFKEWTSESPWIYLYFWLFFLISFSFYPLDKTCWEKESSCGPSLALSATAPLFIPWNFEAFCGETLQVSNAVRLEALYCGVAFPFLWGSPSSGQQSLSELPLGQSQSIPALWCLSLGPVLGSSQSKLLGGQSQHFDVFQRVYLLLLDACTNDQAADGFWSSQGIVAEWYSTSVSPFFVWSWLLLVSVWWT